MLRIVKKIKCIVVRNTTCAVWRRSVCEWQQGAEENIWTQEGCNKTRKKLHKESFHDLYFLPLIFSMIKSRKMKWLRRVYACIGEIRNSFWVLVRKPEWWRPVGRPKLEWKDNTEIYQEETERVWTRFVWFGTGVIGGLLWRHKDTSDL